MRTTEMPRNESDSDRAEPRVDDATEEEYRPTLGDLSHSNPQTGEQFGDAMVYRRGPAVAADGGDPGAPPAETETDAEAETDAAGPEADADGTRLEDVDHTPPRDAEDVNRVHERGGEGRTENV